MENWKQINTTRESKKNSGEYSHSEQSNKLSIHIIKAVKTKSKLPSGIMSQFSIENYPRIMELDLGVSVSVLN